jgi:anion-transporting  ArsA/GET3 family ATPase
MTLSAAVASRRFLVVTGKGGVGKSVVSATLGRIASGEGRHTLLLEVDPRENLHELLGVAPSGGDVVTVAPTLRLQNLQPRQVLEQVVRDHLRVEWLSRRVVASPVFEHFVDAAPGLKELAILGHAFRVLTGRARRQSADLVILDAPATGHGLSMLTAPLVVSDVIKEGPFGHMAGELAAFIGDATETGVVVVCQAEEMPVQEGLELAERMEQALGRWPDLLVVNGLYPPVRGRRGPPDTELARLWHTRRAINERELARLSAAWRGPRVELPFVPIDRGPALPAALAPILRNALVQVEVFA